MDKGDFEVLTHEQAYPVHDAEFKRINSRLRDLEELGEEFVGFREGVNKSFEFVRDRLDARQAQTDAIILMAQSVEHLSKQVEEVVKEMKETTKMTVDHEYRLSQMEESTIKDDIKEIKDAIGVIEDKIIDLKHAPARKIAEYIDNGLKAILVVLFLGFLFFLTNGRLGG